MRTLQKILGISAIVIPLAFTSCDEDKPKTSKEYDPHPVETVQNYGKISDSISEKEGTFLEVQHGTISYTNGSSQSKIGGEHELLYLKFKPVNENAQWLIQPYTRPINLNTPVKVHYRSIPGKALSSEEFTKCGSFLDSGN
jgi:hypothetical protein